MFRKYNYISAKAQFKSEELEFELGHERHYPKWKSPSTSSGPVLSFGKFKGKKLSETPEYYQEWLKRQPWWNQ